MSESLSDMKSRRRKEQPPEVVLKQKDLPVEVVALPPPSTHQPQPEHIQMEDVPRFAPSDEEAYKTYLEEYGYVVIGGVLDDKEVNRAKELLWDFLEKYGMKRDDPSTWGDENFGKIASLSSGIIMRGGIGQSDFQWYCRTRDNVKNVFSAIYETRDLLTSFDGGNIFRPWQAESLVDHCTTSGWLHVDQGRKLRGMQCIQALVTLTDVSEETGGFYCIPRSHHYHDELMVHATNDDNFVKVPADFPCLKDPQIMPRCKAGDMILWDSRTIHCSSPALVQPTLPLDQLLRVASYICMVPSTKADEGVINRRVEMYQCNATGTHWPHLLKFKKNQTDNISKEISELSPEGLSLLVGSTLVTEYGL